jgi:hypothetical protein
VFDPLPISADSSRRRAWRLPASHARPRIRAANRIYSAGRQRPDPPGERCRLDHSRQRLARPSHQ